ncbi:ABC transporter permease [Aquidulcibacter sp.]|uniref:ABC transporter permease n=1 Tax=Aquidulcibacter sp. TaxID=2052990 RepID=UPI0025C6D935|nr:ABC transporter permease [Aquidulcibacter sp.]MCA3696812.1 ABC transporter permease subunit [Aquidulcibacter sp.]
MTAFWTGFCALYRRELRQDAGNPLAYMFVASFISASVLLAFQVGGLFEAGRAELVAFFQFHPWLFVVLMPALSMRAWSDEARTGTLETLLALPVPTSALVLAKFMAAWTLACLMLVLTTPLWLRLSLLGPVDHGATLTAYLGSCLLAGAYLSIGMAASAVSRSQVLSFVIALGVSFLATAAGLPLVSSTLAAFLPLPLTEALASLSMLDAFAGFERGVIEARGLSYFLAVIALGLCLTGLWVDTKRGGQV